MNLQRMSQKNWALINQTNIRVDLDDKTMKLDRFVVKKIVLGTVRGDQFLYLSSRFDYKVSFRFLQCFSLRFLIPFPWWVPSIIQFPLNDLGPPLVDHPGLHLRACSIGHPLRLPLCVGAANTALFRGLLHINATKKLATEPLMRWNQLFLQIFQDIPLHFVFAMLIRAYRLSRNDPWMANHLFGPRLRLSEVTFIIGLYFRAIMTNTVLIIC